MDIQEEFKKFNNKIKKIKDQGAEIQHQKGKLSAMERIILLLDENSFSEIDPLVESRFSQFGMNKKKVFGDGVICGFGRINKRPVCVYSQDFTKIGGSLGEAHAKKIVKVIDLALQTGCPIIGIIDSGGARIQEGVASLDGYAQIFRKMVKASGVIPQIAVIAGPSAGGACYSPGLSDFVFMTKKIGQMYITGPGVIKLVTGEEISLEDLGGTRIHGQKSGCAHFISNSEEECFSKLRSLLSYLPQNNLEDLPQRKSLWGEFFEKEGAELSKIVPADEEKTYDIKKVIEVIFDRESFLEVQADFAKNMVLGFALLQGQTIGIAANQPQHLAGVLDIDSSDKISRFIRFCDAFNIPIVTIVDVPGYLPGLDQEREGIIRHGAKILYSIAEASIPKVSLILRKAYGGAYIALSSRHLGYDRVIAWPQAQIGVMGARQAVKIIYKKELALAKDPEKVEKEKIKEYKKTLSSYQAAQAGQVDIIIDPAETRKTLIETFFSLKNKREPKPPRKHGNIPL